MWRMWNSLIFSAGGMKLAKMAALRQRIFCYAKSLQNFPKLRSPVGKETRIIRRKHIILTRLAPRFAVGFVVPFIPTVHAFWGSKKEEPVMEMSPHEKVIAEADALYDDHNIPELYSVLRAHKNDPIADIQWRLGRAAYEMSKVADKPEEKKAFLYEAFECVKKALELDDNSFAAHKWFAILLDSVGELEGTKQRITNAFQVKDHFMKAIELKPDDATSIHLLGYWCFLFADMPWYQRKVAAVIFASPPTSTYEEALEYFERAETKDPNFFSKNLLMLGKTHLRLKNKEKAKHYLNKTLEYPVKTEDDKASHKEAEDLLKTV